MLWYATVNLSATVWPYRDITTEGGGWGIEKELGWISGWVGVREGRWFKPWVG